MAGFNLEAPHGRFLCPAWGLLRQVIVVGDLARVEPSLCKELRQTRCLLVRTLTALP